MAEFFGDLRFAWRTLFRSPRRHQSQSWRWRSVLESTSAYSFGPTASSSTPSPILAWNESLRFGKLCPDPRLKPGRSRRQITLTGRNNRAPSRRSRDIEPRAQSSPARRAPSGSVPAGCLPLSLKYSECRAKLGRVLSGGEDDASHSDEAVVSEGFWTSHMASSGDLSNALVTVNGHRVRVIGVMPDAFDFPLNTQVWLPIHRSGGETAQRAIHSFAAIALLRPGVSAIQATDEGKAIFERLAKLYPLTNESRGPSVIPLKNLVEGVTNRFIESLLGAALFVLLLACANVGNLQIARAAARQREFAVRSALGASRFRIARHLVAESLVISLAAGVAWPVVCELEFG